MHDACGHTCGGAERHLTHVCGGAACAAAPLLQPCCLQPPLPQPSLAARQLSGIPTFAGLPLEAQPLGVQLPEAQAAPEAASLPASTASSSASSMLQPRLMVAGCVRELCEARTGAPCVRAGLLLHVTLLLHVACCSERALQRGC